MRSMEWNLIDKQAEFLKLLQHQGKSFNTVKNYKADLQCFNTFLIDKQKNLKMKSFSPTQVQEYSQYLDQKYPSSNSVRRRVQALRLFFDFLLGQNLFPENPLKKMTVSPKVLDNPEPSPFPEVIKTCDILRRRVKSSEGLSKLVNARNLMIFHLIYGAGLKVSDLAKLSLASLLKEQKGFRVMVEHPKRDPYSIPLPTSFTKDFLFYRQLLKETLRAQDKEIDEILFNANPYKILAGGLSPRGIELFFEELRREMKSQMTAKSLRQSCIFKWLNLGINHATIREWLGVTPGYSLELYLEELKKNPSGFVFQDMEVFDEL
jgi:site-specific recombinase XerD